MPLYPFECLTGQDYLGCGAVFDITCTMSEISTIKPECPKCGQVDSVFRVWHGYDAAPYHETTLGSLADRNAAKLSDDEKLYLKEKYRTKKEVEKLKPIEKRLQE